MTAPEPLPLTDDLLGVTLLSITQAAEAWGCSRRTVERLLQRRELRYVLLGSDRRIPLTELRRWIDHHLLLDNSPAPTPTALAAVGAPRRTRRSGPA